MFDAADRKAQSASPVLSAAASDAPDTNSPRFGRSTGSITKRFTFAPFAQPASPADAPAGAPACAQLADASPNARPALRLCRASEAGPSQPHSRNVSCADRCCAPFARATRCDALAAESLRRASSNFGSSHGCGPNARGAAATAARRSSALEDENKVFGWLSNDFRFTPAKWQRASRSRASRKTGFKPRFSTVMTRGARAHMKLFMAQQSCSSPGAAKLGKRNSLVSYLAMYHVPCAARGCVPSALCRPSTREPSCSQPTLSAALKGRLRNSLTAVQLAARPKARRLPWLSNRRMHLFTKVLAQHEDIWTAFLSKLLARSCSHSSPAAWPAPQSANASRCAAAPRAAGDEPLATQPADITALLARCEQTTDCIELLPANATPVSAASAKAARAGARNADELAVLTRPPPFEAAAPAAAVSTAPECVSPDGVNCAPRATALRAAGYTVLRSSPQLAPECVSTPAPHTAPGAARPARTDAQRFAGPAGLLAEHAFRSLSQPSAESPGATRAVLSAGRARYSVSPLRINQLRLGDACARAAPPTPERSQARPAAHKFAEFVAALSVDSEIPPHLRSVYSSHFYRQFNRTVFDDRLAPNLPIHWNSRLTRSAGYTRLEVSAPVAPAASGVSINLSSKLLCTVQRLKATLLHEMCHVAQLMLDYDRTLAHRGAFVKWASLAMQRCPEIIIAASHQYHHSSAQLVYRCDYCGGAVTRESAERLRTTRCAACKIGTLRVCGRED